MSKNYPKFRIEDYNPTNNEDTNLLSSPITFEELDFAIKSSKSNSAPGEDKINYEIIKFIPEALQRVLLDIFNDCFSSGLYPDSWNTQLISFIPKNDSNKARPIALASCFLKLFEKIITNRLTWYTERNNFLSNSQFGFRKSKSCIDNLNIFVNFTQQAFYKGEKVAALFLDIKGAYNCVIPDLLLKDLSELNLPKEYIVFFEKMLTERILIPTNLAKDTEQESAHLGLGQGSGLSPFLWAIYTRFIQNCVHPNIKILQFADDIVIFIKSKHIKEAVLDLEREANHLYLKLSQKNLYLAPEKCELIIFSQQYIKKKLSVNLNNKKLNATNHIRFLGLHLGLPPTKLELSY